VGPHFFVTGGTGIVGFPLLPRLLRAYPGSTITLLVRASDDGSADARGRSLAEAVAHEFGIPDAPRRISAVRGDVAYDHLGLTTGQIDALIRTVTHIIHGAATIRFDHPLDEARRINVGGVRRMLQLAEQCAQRGRLRRFLAIGTSSVSGRREGPIYEHELDVGQSFFNTYEQSKCESERILRDHARRLPITIVRPSIVIGDSTTGKTPTFNVIYIPLRLFHRGLLPFIPARPETLLDLVPVDWVDDAIAYLVGREQAEGKVCHLTAGPSRATPLGELIGAAAAAFDRWSPLERPRTLEFISQEEFVRRAASLTGKMAALMRQLEALLPYVTVDRLFDSRTTDALLEGSGITFPRFRDYGEKILSYCVETDWGKKRT
jgi:thioester reductase-like protein